MRAAPEEITAPSAEAPADEACMFHVEHHCVYCPTCSTRLKDHRCKLICTQCGYFLSCADFY